MQRFSEHSGSHEPASFINLRGHISVNMSTGVPSLSAPLKPSFSPTADVKESPIIQSLIDTLNLQKHPEGGYYVEIDRDPLRVPNPFHPDSGAPRHQTSSTPSDDSTRSASTTIYYLLTPGQPQGVFHRNKGRTVHTLHRGRGRYVIIHSDDRQGGEKACIETFVVGQGIHSGERLQWIVEGGKYKASFLLPDKEGGQESEGLLISEVCW